MNNKKTTKRALLSSVMAIVLCLAMLIGTTFAWFTDSASTAVNKIQAGTLEIELQYATAWDASGVPTAWADAEGKTLNFRKAAGAAANEAILWEPGCTYKLPELRIVNKGNLALQYKILITGIAGDAKLNEVIDWEWAGCGIDENGVYKPRRGGDLSSGDIIFGSLKPNTITDDILISGSMKKEAGNEYQGKSIDGIGITVVATQATYEKDSKDDQYDKDAQYPDVDVVTVTPDTIPSPFKADTAYFFEAGNYGDQHFVITDKENVTLIGKTGAKFDSLQISSIDYVNPSIGQKVDLDNSTLTVKGFEVAKTLMIVEADKNVVVEDNTAAQITVKANLSSQSIAVNNNIITGGDGAANSYGVYIVPNVTDYDLTVTGNSFTNVKSHAISVQGCGDGSAVTAAKSITVTGNTFTSYGTNNKTGRAAFKIWEDTKLAPNGTDPLNDAANALAKTVKENNSFAADLGENCLVADFYGKTVAFN